MWLTQKLNKEKGLSLSGGKVSGGAEFSVSGDREYASPEMLAPYGFSSRAEAGERAVMLDGYCAGVSALPDSGLAPGEVRLYSSGGAEIVLKADGRVLINGRSFARE